MTDWLVAQPSVRTRVFLTIKILHTLIWAFFVACILALPVAGWLHRFDWAVVLTVLVLIECGVLAANRWRCPMTDLAARCTVDRSENFDIYLPKWLARHNKTIFGTLLFVNECLVLWAWLHYAASTCQRRSD